MNDNRSRLNDFVLKMLDFSDDTKVNKLVMATAQLSPPEQQVADFLADILHLEAIETGFNCFLTHRPDITKANEANSKEEFIKIIRSIQAENAANAASNTEAAVKYYVAQTASNTNSRKLKQLFSILHHAVNNHVVQARLVCESILNSDKLVRCQCDLFS